MKPATTPPSTAVEVPLRLDNVAPASLSRRRPTATRDRSCRDRLRGRHRRPLGPEGGEISFRRLGADDWAELPTKLVTGRRTPRGWSRPSRATSGRDLPVPRRCGRLAPATLYEHASRRRHRDGAAHVAVAARGRAARRVSGEDPAVRPAALAAPNGPRITVPFGAAADPQRPPRRRRRRRPCGSPAASRLAALAWRPLQARVDEVEPAPTAASGCRCPPGPHDG